MKLVLCPICGSTPVIATPVLPAKGLYMKDIHIDFSHSPDLTLLAYQSFIETAISNWLYKLIEVEKEEEKAEAITMYNRTISSSTGKIQTLTRFFAFNSEWHTNV